MLAAALLTAALQPHWVPPLPRPLVVLRAFAPPAQRWLAGHRGVDLEGPVGATVHAAGAGRISFAGRLAGRGVVVVVHGELRTTYEPLAATVPAGALVAEGDAIGVLRAGHDPGRPAAGVLHWGLLRGQTYLDPMSLLAAARPVRLLPHWAGQPALPAAALLTQPGRRTDARPESTKRGYGARPVLHVVLLAATAAMAAAASRRPP